MPSTVVGLDLSLTSTGWSAAGEVAVIATAAKGPQRLHEVSQEIASRLIELDDPAVVVEGYSFASRNSQAHAIGELGGVVRLTLWNLRIPYVEVPPTSRAKFATGRGNASKGEVVSAVSARTGLVFAGKGADDMVDAWVLEEMGRCVLGTARHDWPAANREALTKVDWSPLLG
jgi:Holliday junction resolvasome RuvABC endonuclease subunit